MVTLTEFLAARLDEEEREADEFHREGCEALPEPGYTGPFPCNCSHPDKLRREAEAKRAILALHAPKVLRYGPERGPWCSACGGVDEDDDYFAVEWPCPTVRHLAVVYSGHRDYDPDWAPS